MTIRQAGHREFVIERLCRLPVVGLVPRYLRALAYLPRMQRSSAEQGRPEERIEPATNGLSEVTR